MHAMNKILNYLSSKLEGFFQNNFSTLISLNLIYTIRPTFYNLYYCFDGSFFLFMHFCNWKITLIHCELLSCSQWINKNLIPVKFKAIEVPRLSINLQDNLVQVPYTFTLWWPVLNFQVAFKFLDVSQLMEGW